MNQERLIEEIIKEKNAILEEGEAVDGAVVGFSEGEVVVGESEGVVVDGLIEGLLVVGTKFGEIVGTRTGIIVGLLDGAIPQSKTTKTVNSQK